jgi:hypothetical protein
MIRLFDIPFASLQALTAFVRLAIGRVPYEQENTEK